MSPLAKFLTITGAVLPAVRAIWPRVPVKARPWVIAGVSLFIFALYAWIILTLARLNNQ